MANIIQTVLSVAACKAVRGVLRLTRHGGTALPGKAARVFDRNILETTSRGMEIIAVTGTNGKTTTCRMLEHALRSAGREVLANKSGANLLSGVTAEITCNATWLGRPKTHYAVIECDEGALKQVVPLIHPKVVLVTNLFRDQLDRYGEVMHTLEQIRTGIRKAPEAAICLNADCSLTSSLARDIPNRVLYYGISTPVGDQKDVEISDAKYCINCGTKYEYHYHTYAHLGGFYCPKCGYARVEHPDVSVTAIEETAADGSTVQMELTSQKAVEKRQVRIGLPAVYNIYNAAGAVCAYRAFGLPAEEILQSLADVHSGFGRMETFHVGSSRNLVQMILVKNPAGCSQAIRYVTGLKVQKRLILCLNDRTADGHDISWIWDADYELIAQDSLIQEICVYGDRAEDMQLRLKYAGVEKERIHLFRSADRLLQICSSGSMPTFILPNYTSMLKMRQTFSRATGAGEFWK